MVKVIGFVEEDFGEGVRLFSEHVVVLSPIGRGFSDGVFAELGGERYLLTR